MILILTNSHVWSKHISNMNIYKHIHIYKNLLPCVCISLCGNGCRALQYYSVSADGELFYSFFSVPIPDITLINCTQGYAKFIMIVPCTLLSSASFCLFHSSSLTVWLNWSTIFISLFFFTIFPFESTCQKYELLTSNN